MHGIIGSKGAPSDGLISCRCLLQDLLNRQHGLVDKAILQRPSPPHPLPPAGDQVRVSDAETEVGWGHSTADGLNDCCFGLVLEVEFRDCRHLVQQSNACHQGEEVRQELD